MCVLKQGIPPYNQKPFHFIETGINVYSFEELLFHCFHYWKESVNDFLEGRISLWVRDTLSLSFIAGQIDKIACLDEMLSEKYLKFLALEGYIDEDDLKALEFSIMMWENKSELDKLKQQGDERLKAEDYEKAALYYSKLLSYGENAMIFNNMGCCYMKMRMYGEAEQNFQKALGLEKRNYRIKLNLAMLYFLENKSQAAEDMLLELEKTDNGSEVQYYLGLMELRRSNLKKAERYFLRSSYMGNVLDANAALCKIEMKKKDYERAIMYLDQMPDKNSWQYLYNMSKLKYQTGDKEGALTLAETLLVTDFCKAGNWAFAAKLYRETGNLEKASECALKALELDPSSEEGIFEYALINKAMGKSHEYQSSLKQIIDRWKSKYKEAN